ncbi:phosphate signaling complex protein PhoU [Sphingorhabdus sp.]|jgi:phosphate transport system protein|uniref:phosphate signaling complex protein PhoU n=1 Tax=Sphingorhabdus sp. TaxID=1902408 RepID=UPI003BAE3611|nr:phosphate signaling complex protein PhoU [Sphingomonadales bacterium]MBL0021225.1 phosphate signaling complex protein PhoU [Sphingomonadales bacterium]
MSTGTRHTLSAFDDDMDQIRGLISEMGARAEAAVTNAMQALLHHDLDLATQTRADDKIIDRLEEDVEKQVVQTIALRAPMADDLRELIAALKIAAVIERIADYAKNISKRVHQVDHSKFLSKNKEVVRMGEIAVEMIRMVMDAYAKRDIEMAQAACARDDDIDQIHRDLFVDYVAYVAKHPAQAEEIAHLLFISKNLERVGDHATTCAQMIYFTETGENMPDA